MWFILCIFRHFLPIFQEETVLDILGLAHQYGFEDLESAICDYLKDTLCILNICVIYDMASLYNLSNLKAVCEDFMDKNALSILNHESFYALSPVSFFFQMSFMESGHFNRKVILHKI